MTIQLASLIELALTQTMLNGPRCQLPSLKLLGPQWLRELHLMLAV